MKVAVKLQDYFIVDIAEIQPLMAILSRGVLYAASTYYPEADTHFTPSEYVPQVWMLGDEQVETPKPPETPEEGAPQ
jgi:hypothetical protein